MTHLPNTPKPMIQIQNVYKAFRGGRDQVLKGVSIDFPEGKLTYILGSSGAGKSVMIKHILGLLKPDRGTVLVDGQDMAKLKGRSIAEHRRIFGMLFQNAALFDDFTVFENVAFPLREHTELSDSEIEQKVVRTLDMLKLPGGQSVFDKFPNELSGGMRKRVGLARAIIREPRILLYDEPTTGLDPVTRQMVDELIGTLKTELKLTSVVISHDIPSALQLSDQIAFLHEGQILFLGVAKDFRKSQHPAIRQFLEAEERHASAFQLS